MDCYRPRQMTDDDRRQRPLLVWPPTLCVGGPVINECNAPNSGDTELIVIVRPLRMSCSRDVTHCWSAEVHQVPGECRGYSRRTCHTCLSHSVRAFVRSADHLVTLLSLVMLTLGWLRGTVVERRYRSSN